MWLPICAISTGITMADRWQYSYWLKVMWLSALQLSHRGRQRLRHYGLLGEESEDQWREPPKCPAPHWAGVQPCRLYLPCVPLHGGTWPTHLPQEESIKWLLLQAIKRMWYCICKFPLLMTPTGCTVIPILYWYRQYYVAVTQHCHNAVTTPITLQSGSLVSVICNGVG